MKLESIKHVSASTITEERLPFSIRIARSEADIRKAVAIRHVAYGRHVPELAGKLKEPEACDFDPTTTVFLAESKFDGQPIGSMRIQSNRSRQLSVEHSVELPSWLDGSLLVEATRLGVTHRDRGSLVKSLLFKAVLAYCRNIGVDWIVITARPPLDQMYETFTFQDILPEAGYVPMAHVGNIPHKVMAIEVATVENHWRALSHPLYKLFFLTEHPDIDIEGYPVLQTPYPIMGTFHPLQTPAKSGFTPHLAGA